MQILPYDEWAPRAAAHAARVDIWLEPHLARRRLFQRETLEILGRDAGLPHAVADGQPAEAYAVAVEKVEKSPFDPTARLWKVAARRLRAAGRG